MHVIKIEIEDDNILNDIEFLRGLRRWLGDKGKLAAVHRVPTKLCECGISGYETKIVNEKYYGWQICALCKLPKYNAELLTFRNGMNAWYDFSAPGRNVINEYLQEGEQYETYHEWYKAHATRLALRTIEIQDSK